MESSPHPYTRSSSWASLSPTLNVDFFYRPSGEILSGSYRIVNVLPGKHEDPIQCRLQEVSLKDTSARFLALSYCWKSSSADQTIWCDGRPMAVTANLFAALRNARASNSVVSLWIDQICVDQANIIDRNDQVSKMGAIYRAAGGVIIWLGEESSGSAAAMELPKRIKKFWPSLYTDPSELTDRSKTPPELPHWGEGAWLAFILLLTRPWFRRLWVIQEVVCAKDIVITCGTSTAFWSDFVKVVTIVEALQVASHGPNKMLGSKTAAQYIFFMEELRDITEKGTKQAVKDYASEESMAPYVLTMAKDCEATDHRDKLFAFHHLVRLWNKPDYGMPIEMLYQLFAVQYLQRIAYAISEFSCDEKTLFRRQLEFIYSAGLHNQLLNLPSWVPDWSRPWLARPLWLGSNCYAAGGNDIKEIAPLTELDESGKPHFRLPIQVKIFDRVLAAGSNALAISKWTTLSDALRNWLFQATSLLHMHRTRPIPYKDPHTAMAMTITAGQSEGGSILADEEAAKQYHDLLESLREVDTPRRDSTGFEVHEQDRFHYTISSFLRGRVFFVTEKGYYGLAQEGLLRGDGIAVIRGAPIPVILRPNVSTEPNPQEHRMLCETFVLGIMDGEAWNDETLPRQDVVLV